MNILKIYAQGMYRKKRIANVTLFNPWEYNLKYFWARERLIIKEFYIYNL